MSIEETVRARGLALPDLETLWRVNPSRAQYVSHLPVQNLLYLCGYLPYKDNKPYLTGVLGRDLTVEQGHEAARYAAYCLLGAIRYALGDLDRVDRFVQLIGYVNSTPDFSDQPLVINGAADLLVDLYGERGKPTRAAIGCQGLGGGHSIELVTVISFTGDGVRPPLDRDKYRP